LGFSSQPTDPAAAAVAAVAVAAVVAVVAAVAVEHSDIHNTPLGATQQNLVYHMDW
jgi:hypothetical protein